MQKGREMVKQKSKRCDGEKCEVEVKEKGKPQKEDWWKACAEQIKTLPYDLCSLFQSYVSKRVPALSNPCPERPVIRSCRHAFAQKTVFV
jgi:hypothetical protein